MRGKAKHSEPFTDIHQTIIEAATKMAATILKAEVGKVVQMLNSSAEGMAASIVNGMPAMALLYQPGQKKAKRPRKTNGRKARRMHTDEFKHKVVLEAKESGTGPTAKKHGLAPSLVHNWIKRKA